MVRDFTHGCRKELWDSVNKINLSKLDWQTYVKLTAEKTHNITQGFLSPPLIPSHKKKNKQNFSGEQEDVFPGKLCKRLTSDLDHNRNVNTPDHFKRQVEQVYAKSRTLKNRFQHVKMTRHEAKENWSSKNRRQCSIITKR
ncbi:hypothetical protein GJAV_G00256080 [Gymnothorax javanicus]|nr:hypothetical protein GJAV_G00256080 [Gymnothorax javanicus]